MRALQRELQDEIERIDPARAWPEVSQRIQADTAAAVRAAFLEATDGAAAIQGTIAGLLADETPGLDGVGAPVSFDVATLLAGRPDLRWPRQVRLAASLGLFGGASVGVEMLGMLGTLLGAAVVGPAALGVAAVFGGKEVLSERRRQLADRRQQARAFLGTFLEEVRFEADGRPRLAPRRRPAPDARPLRRPDPRAPPDVRRDRRGARTRRRAGRRGGTARRPELAAELAEIDALRARAVESADARRLSPFGCPGKDNSGWKSGSCRLLQSRPWHRLRRG